MLNLFIADFLGDHFSFLDNNAGQGNTADNSTSAIGEVSFSADSFLVT